MNFRYPVIAALAGGVMLFAWQTISNVALPWHESTIREFADNTAIVQSVRNNAPVNGMYVSANGILAAVNMNPDMADKSQDMNAELIRQIILDIVVALLAAFVVLRVRQRSILQTAAVLLMLGLAANGLKELSDWNWYGFSLPYALVNTIDHGIQWFLLGAFLAWLARKYAGPTAVGA